MARPLSSGSLALLLSALGPAAGAAPLTIVNQELTIEVNADATYVVEEALSARIEEPQVIAQAGQLPIPFSESLQQLEILEAYTTTKGGTRIDVPPDKIIVQQLPASAGAPVYSDFKQKVVIFPQVEIGATLTLRSRRTQVRPFLAGVFSIRNGFSRHLSYGRAAVTLRAPKELALHVEARDVEGGEVRASKAGMREWRWTYGESKGIPAEPQSVSPDDYSPYVAASTLKDYEALAAAYAVGVAQAAKVTPEIQKLADEVTQGLSDRRAQAEALYRWVSGNIRYVALAMDMGGYVPHAAADVLNAHYGDCKDKAVLLQALLAAKGIRSRPALVNAGNAYELAGVALLSSFNHVITYLPDLRLFADSTSGLARFGALPDALAGKQALIVGDDTQTARLEALPVPSASTDRITLRTVAELASDGTVMGTNHIEATGIYEQGFRTAVASVPQAQLPVIGARLLAGAGQTGEAHLQPGDVRDLTRAFTFDAVFTLPNRVKLPGPGAITGHFGIRPPLDLGQFVAGVTQRERNLEFPCLSGAFEELIELSLPEGFSISSLPQPAAIRSSLGSYDARYEQQAGKLLIKRRLTLNYPRVTCNHADSLELRKFGTAVGQDLRAQILYQ